MVPSEQPLRDEILSALPQTSLAIVNTIAGYTRDPLSDLIRKSNKTNAITLQPFPRCPLEVSLRVVGRQLTGVAPSRVQASDRLRRGVHGGAVDFVPTAVDWRGIRSWLVAAELLPSRPVGPLLLLLRAAASGAAAAALALVATLVVVMVVVVFAAHGRAGGLGHPAHSWPRLAKGEAVVAKASL